MYYLKNRYYDPRLRRFICADSLKALKAGEDFGGKNLYVYCNGNPVAMLDDEGEFAISLVKMAVGAVVNVATTYIAAKVTGQEYGLWNCADYNAYDTTYISSIFTKENFNHGRKGLYHPFLWKRKVLCLGRRDL